MRVLFNQLLLVLFFIGGTVIYENASAHGGDEHGMPQAEESKIIGYAHYVLADKVKRGELAASWEQSSFDSIRKIEHRFQPEWVVVFVNQEAPAGERRYFIFFDLEGAYLGSNFTGK